MPRAALKCEKWAATRLCCGSLLAERELEQRTLCPDWVKDSTSTCRARVREEHFALAQKAVEIEHLEQVGTNPLLSPCLVPAALCAWDT